MTKHSTIIWFRRDLRLTDNRALSAAINYATIHRTSIIPVFIFDGNILGKLDSKKDRRVSFIWQCISELKDKITTLGGVLRIFKGTPEKVLKELAEHSNAQAIFCNEDYDPYSVRRDKLVVEALQTVGCAFESYKDHVIFSRMEIAKDDGTPYKVFTPYKNKWLKNLTSAQYNECQTDLQALSTTLKRQVPKDNLLKSISITSFQQTGFDYSVPEVTGGESRALVKFCDFKKTIDNYSEKRDQYGIDGTSGLSPYIRFGCISTRFLVQESLKKDSPGSQSWLNEIIWRDFYNMILTNFPTVSKRSFKPKYATMKYPGKRSHFQLWVDGLTGYPVIDAAMRKFKKTGMMHNRLRMIVASFFTKHLLLDWRLGERYFAQNLLDYDLASNNGGWQWAASTGCDAQPYFRIFNPYSQSLKFDRAADFIKQEIPELRLLPAKYAHQPHTAPLEVQQKALCMIGRDYPNPIVDHSTQRIKAIDMFKNI